MGYSEFEQLNEAELAFKRAIELSPNYAQAYQWYGELLGRMPDHLDQAAALLERAAELDPLSSIIQCSRARVLRQLGRFEESEALLLRITELDPDFPRAYVDLASLYFGEMGQFAKALKWSQAAREKDPGNMNILEFQAVIYLNVGNDEAAERVRNQMQDIDPQHILDPAALVHRVHRTQHASAF